MTKWIVDTSAFVRLGSQPDAETWSNNIDRGLVYISTLTLLELGYSARTGDEARRELTSAPLSLMTVVNLTPKIEQRALEVQTILADKGTHRAPSVADLLIAATAEIAGITVLHVDKDFELIAEVTGQPLQRLAQ